jgi:hypothetical protein
MAARLCRGFGPRSPRSGSSQIGTGAPGLPLALALGLAFGCGLDLVIRRHLRAQLIDVQRT